jgi:orotate phosphoribosyltransferase
MSQRGLTPTGTSISHVSEDLVKVSFSGVLRMSVLEQELANSFTHTSRAPVTIFDLTNVEWIGYLPAKLLFCWAATLRLKRERRVSIKLPKRESLNPQLRKVLIEHGTIAQMKNIGVEVPYASSPLPRFGIPLNILTVGGSLWDDLQNTVGGFVQHTDIPDSSVGFIRNIFNVIVFELLENAFVHGGAALPHYGVSLAQTPNSTPYNPRWISAFDPNTPYIEIYVGDLGPGIEANLETHVPDTYEPPFITKHRFLRPEQILTYAFEFSSTSNAERRKLKIRDLLAYESLDPSEVATGLYCVLDFARSQGGQFIVRTPKALLSFDFYPAKYNPVIKGRKELGINKLGPLPGTHYLIRLPLTEIETRRARTIRVQSTFGAMPRRVVDAFGSATRSEDPVSVLQSAIDAVDKDLIVTRNVEGLTMILQPRFSLPSRAEAVFLAAVQAMNHGQRRVIWLNERFSATEHGLLERDPAKMPKSSISRQTVLVGDLFANVFTYVGNLDARWLSIMEELDHTTKKVSFKPIVYTALHDAYQEYNLKTLQSILSNHEVRHSGEPFLIEGQYYTDIFFETPRAWENKDDIRLFAEWALDKLDPDTDIVIGQTSTVLPWVKTLASLIEVYRGKRATIIEHDVDSPARTISQTVSLAGRRAVILTDVICTGKRLRESLQIITGVEVDRILALVDGRSDEAGQPVSWVTPSGKRLVDLHAILTEKIPTYHESPPSKTRENNSESEADLLLDERVFVIDRRTRAPTLYVRPTEPRLNLRSLLTGPAKEANALFFGHSEVRGKHYSFFLNLPKLFAGLRSEIESWVGDQVDSVASMSMAAGEPWYAYVYNPDEGLSWMLNFLPSLPQQPTVRVLEKKHLRAPSPPRLGGPSGNWLIVIPALASGESARLCIEYVSRHRPATILVLCVASRMDPYNLTFHTGVRRYRSAELRMACFLDFQVATYAGREGICPQCTELAKLEQLQEAVETVAVRKAYSSRVLLESVKRKISAGQAIPLESDWQDTEISTSPSEHDFERAYVRALFESSSVNLEARRELNALLENDSSAIDRFLEVLASERHARLFSSSELKTRLYKAEPLIYQRISDIVQKEKPPYPIGRVMGAIVHLTPHLLVDHAIEMIHRFATSQRDVEDICLALLQTDAEPSDVGEFFATFSEEKHGDIATLFTQTLDMLRHTKETNIEMYRESIAAISKLWARLTRSSHFFSPLVRLAQTPLERYMAWPEVQGSINEVWDAWRGEIAELVFRTQRGPLWPRLSRRWPDLSRSLTIIERDVALLDRLGKVTWDPMQIETLPLNNVKAIALEVKEASDNVATYIHEFVINPALCAAAKLGDHLIAHDGSILEVEKNVDQYVSVIFCDMQDLNSACAELISNWQKHKKAEKRGSKVFFNLFQEGDMVILEFGDDIEGDFDLQSEGGLDVVLDCCFAYGGELDVISDEAQKALRMIFRGMSSVESPEQSSNETI